eukprot:GEMP01022535.1.p1 GENE.GEMP01022535.1~~GEMP01022535.1.p1  ORF type:complete len:616 (+),score=96.75 GEMP01022535.1:129-1976(+)
MKRALCVGCNYPTKATGLNGAVNDAFLMAAMLQAQCGFDEANITVLHDVIPGQPKKVPVPPKQNSTRANILEHLTRLIIKSKPGDSLFFSFSGLGLQVDDLEGYQDEGYDEAILPTDYMDGRGGDCTVIVTDTLRDAFTHVPKGCSLTVLMDCDHSSTVSDVDGIVHGDSVQGLKSYSTFWCGIANHTSKTEYAKHCKSAWSDEPARSLKTKPKFHQTMNISNPRKGRQPHRGVMSSSRPVTFCYGASKFGQTSLELHLPKIDETGAVDEEAKQSHGVLTWSFVRGMGRLGYDCTYAELLEVMSEEIRAIKEKFVPLMDQEVMFTFTKPAADPHTMRVLQPPYGASYRFSTQSLTCDSQRNSSRKENTPTPRNMPATNGRCNGLANGNDTVGRKNTLTRARDINLSLLPRLSATESEVSQELAANGLKHLEQPSAGTPFRGLSTLPSSPLAEAAGNGGTMSDEEVVPAPGYFNLAGLPSPLLQMPNLSIRPPALLSYQTNLTTVTPPCRLTSVSNLSQPTLGYPSFPQRISTVSHTRSRSASGSIPMALQQPTEFQQNGGSVIHTMTDLRQAQTVNYNAAFKHFGNHRTTASEGGTRTTMCSDGSRRTQLTLNAL